MEYILNDKVKIGKPIMFLCGPYSKKDDVHDRRNILSEKINEIYHSHLLKREAIPLIVDNFLTKEDDDKRPNIDFSVFSIQLIEEICASISCETQFFLDTMSSAAELGNFANSMWNNSLKVYIPKNSDIYNKGNVGYYVREVVLSNPNTHIEVIEYRPKVELVAFSSRHCAEFYYFINDRLPSQIEDAIKASVETNVSKLEGDIKLVDFASKNKKFSDIFISINEGKIVFNLSLKLLFYVVVSILQLSYPAICDADESLLYDDINNKYICDRTKEALLNYWSVKEGKDKESIKEVELTTNLDFSEDKLVSHITKFVYVYYYKSQYRNRRLLTQSEYLVKEIDGFRSHPSTVFAIDSDDELLCENIISSPDNFFEKSVVKARKRREIIKYRDTESGMKARVLHEKLAGKFSLAYRPSNCSFAYVKGRSIKQCVEKHLSSVSFIKLDVKNFFNSIQYDLLMNTLIEELDIDNCYRGALEKIIKTCFCNQELPLGLCFSPMLSDCYMKSIDILMEEYAKTEGLRYSRYADDIMISSSEHLSEEKQKGIIAYVEKLLSDKRLRLNAEKTRIVDFDKSHSFVRYVGINIVRDVDGKSNYLSVGKKYIYDLAKEYMVYEKMVKELGESASAEDKKTLFYKRAEIIGRIDFIRQIEGPKGENRLLARLKKAYPEIQELVL